MASHILFPVSAENKSCQCPPCSGATSVKYTNVFKSQNPKITDYETVNKLKSTAEYL